MFASGPGKEVGSGGRKVKPYYQDDWVTIYHLKENGFMIDCHYVNRSRKAS